MKKINFKKALASVAALSVIACMAAIPASANSANTSTPVSSFATTTKGAGIAFEQVTVTLDDLKAANYQVPVLIRVNPNPGVTALEFGVQIPTTTAKGVAGVTYTFAETSKSAKTFAQLQTAGQQDYTDLDVICKFKQSDVDPSMTWLTNAEDKPIADNENYGMIIVTVPEGVQAGDQIDIKYAAQGVGENGRPSMFQVKENGVITDYLADSNFEGMDGWIKIEGVEETTTTTTTTETTTTTTTTSTSESTTTTSTSTSESTTTTSTSTSESTTTTSGTTNTTATTKATTATTKATTATTAASSTGSPKTGASDVLPIAGAAAAVAVLGGVALVAKKKND